MAKADRLPRIPPVLTRGLARDRETVQAFVDRCRPVVEALGAPALLAEVDQLAASAHKPFLFVAVGEVKSGKSSLINALLEAPVCAVDSAPCTDRVQEINYGARKRRISVSHFEEQLQLPHDILKYISIVDTPGVNSIIRDHQRITENYIPQSDLILFVFFAKNPYTGSAWDFLHQIKHDWQRNTLFVLQQADLLDAEELERTVSLVTQHLNKVGIAKPVVFPVSVLTGAGVDALRDYLRIKVVKGRQFNKSISLTHNLLRFLHRVEGALNDHVCLLRHDEVGLAEFRELVRGTAGEAEREYQSIAALARHHAEETQRWLDTHFGATDGQFTPTSHRAPTGGQGSSLLERLRLHGQDLAGSDTLHDALLSGWKTPLRVTGRFAKLQSAFTRCLFQAEMRSLNLFQNRKRHALQSIEAIPAEPPCLTQPPRDALARRRLQALKRIRKAVQTIGEQSPPHPAPQLPRMRALGRWPLVDRLLQGGTGLGSLLVGYNWGDVFTALLLGVGGYLGVGIALAVRNRARTAKHARKVLDRGLNVIDQRLKVTLLSNARRLQETLQRMLNGSEANLAKRRAKIEELQAMVTALRAEVEHFESSAWINAVERED